MILERLITYLSQRRVAGAYEISRAIDASPDAVRGMLETLHRRGLVHPVQVPQGCGSSCRQCTQVASDLYAIGPESAETPDGGGCGRLA